LVIENRSVAAGFRTVAALQTLIFEEDYESMFVQTDGFIGAGSDAVWVIALPAKHDLNLSLGKILVDPQARQLRAALAIMGEGASQCASLAVAAEG
jgi:hypothetical protein